jgi:hypothetical protein
VRIDVDTRSYASAATQLYLADHAVVDAVSRTSSAAAGGAAMAGSDSGGTAFARQYDAAAGPLIRAGAHLGASAGRLANLLNVSLVNHEAADYGARIAGPPYVERYTGDSDPDDYAETLLTPAPPSAAGGTGEVPGWWHWVSAHVEGLLWPDADTAALRSVGRGWVDGAADVELTSSYAEAAAAEVGVLSSPEIHDAVATCRDLGRQATSLGAAYREIGQACLDYADAVDEHRRQVAEAIADFVAWTVLIEGAGAVLSEIGGELVAQGAEAAKVAAAGRRIAEILRPLVELAQSLAARLVELSRVAATAVERLRVILGARSVRAVERSAEAVATAERRALVAELDASGVKYDPDQLLAVFRTADGRVVWLETGDEQRGLTHVLATHGRQFLAHGFGESEVPDLLRTALQEGRIVGYQGVGTGRPIYELVFGGKVVKVAITVGANGYIVGANLR